MVPVSFTERQPSASPNASWAARWLWLWCIAFASLRLLGPGGFLYWDSFGYVAQAHRGDVGGLFLGRPFFVITSQVVARVWLQTLGSVGTLEPALRAFWGMISALAAPAVAEAARRYGAAPRAATVAGLVVALSPAWANTADAVLTDAPAMALIALSYAVFGVSPSCSRLALSGLLLGASVATREPSATHALLFVYWLSRQAPSRLPRIGVFALSGLAIPALSVCWSQLHTPDYWARFAAWRVAMRAEGLAHPWHVAELRWWFLWLVALSVAGLWGLLRWFRGAREARAVVYFNLAQLAALAFYQDVSFSPRYLLGAFAMGVALPAGFGLAGVRRGCLAMVLVIPWALGGGLLAWRQRPLVRLLAEVPRRSEVAAERAEFWAGQSCGAIGWSATLHAATRARGLDWQRVCAGWGWPEDVEARLRTSRRSGRQVVLDLRPGAWPGARQEAARDALERAWPRVFRPNELVIWR